MGQKSARSKRATKNGFQLGHKSSATKPKKTRTRMPDLGGIWTKLSNVTTRLRKKPTPEQSVPAFNMLMSSTTINAVLGLFPCLQCGSIGTMNITPTSLKGVVVSFVISCNGHATDGSKCSYRSEAYKNEDYASKKDKHLQAAIHDIKYKPTVSPPASTGTEKTQQKHTVV